MTHSIATALRAAEARAERAEAALIARAEASLEGVTQGPWRVGPVDDCRVEDAGGNEVAMIDGDYNQPETWPLMEANARFIAASRQLVPDLIAALIAAEAMVAAAYRDAAEVVLVGNVNTPPFLRPEHSQAILTRIPADAQATLDRITAAAVNEALERAAKMIEGKAEDYDREYGAYDYSTGVTEYPGNGEEWMEEWQGLAAAIRAMKGGA